MSENPFYDAAKRLKSFNKDKVLVKYMMERKEEIIDWNRSNLKDKGIYDTGEQIKEFEPYSPTTSIVYGRKDKTPTSKVTLYDTGDFQEEFYVVKGEDYVEVTSGDDKTELLEERYNYGGRNIFGLTEEQKGDLFSLFEEDFKNDLLKAISG